MTHVIERHAGLYIENDAPGDRQRQQDDDGAPTPIDRARTPLPLGAIAAAQRPGGQAQFQARGF
ncbi:hypothetical protein LMJ63_25550, partial [Escherichia coli]